MRYLFSLGLFILLFSCQEEPIIRESTVEKTTFSDCTKIWDWVFSDHEPCSLDIPLFPSTFTPNGDGVHDVWKLISKENILEVKALVFNRWGELIYKSNDINTLAWNGFKISGAEAPVGNYSYSSELLFQDGTRCITKGYTTLIR